jgi:hypothetical protein
MVLNFLPAIRSLDWLMSSMIASANFASLPFTGSVVIEKSQ